MNTTVQTNPAPVVAPAAPAPRAAKPSLAKVARKAIASAKLTLASANAKEREVAALAPRSPVSPTEAVFSRMIAAARKASAAPLPAPVSLRSLFEVSGGKIDTEREVLALTAEQRPLWRPVAKALAKAHSQWVRAHKGQLIRAVQRIARDGDALLSGGTRKNKQGRIVAARISARL